MFNFKETLQAIRRERDAKQAEVDKLDQAISALQILVGKAAPAKSQARGSVLARPRISQKAKRKISAQGLRNIVAAQKRRWDKVRAATKAKTATAKKALLRSAIK